MPFFFAFSAKLASTERVIGLLLGIGLVLLIIYKYVRTIFKDFCDLTIALHTYTIRIIEQQQQHQQFSIIRTYIQ